MAAVILVPGLKVRDSGIEVATDIQYDKIALLLMVSCYPTFIKRSLKMGNFTVRLNI